MTKLPQNKLNVKLIALDLDDTLLDNNGNISNENVLALQKCAAQGIYVVLCSGRPEEGILPFVRRLNIAGEKTGRFLIAINGCSDYDMHLRRQIYRKSVSSEILLKVNAEAAKLGLDTEVYSPDTIFYGKETEWTLKDVLLCKIKGKVVENYEKFLENDFPKMLVPGSPEKLSVLENKLKSELGQDKVSVFLSKPFFLEILPPSCGKGYAIEFLAEHLGIPMENTMAFGDSMNDESMIRQCGFGVAMNNARTEIKECADFITALDNNNSGVGDFLEKYVL